MAFGVVRAGLDGPLLDALAVQVAEGGLDPHEASEKLLSSVGFSPLGGPEAGPEA
jgi:hypothetical protein